MKTLLPHFKLPIPVILIVLLLPNIAFGQATLPLSRTGWGGAEPTGWTNFGSTQRTNATACSGNDAAIFSATGDSRTVNFSSAPNQLVFKLVDISMNGNSNLFVEESANAVTWTAVGTYGTANGATAIVNCANITVTLLSSSRYVRWTFTKANGGCDMDDVSISAFGSSPTDHFRTKVSGNWNSSSTWESSTDNTTWNPATLSPDFNANTITILDTHTATVTANLTIDQTTINAGGSVLINPNVILTVNNGTGTDITVNSGGFMTIKSTSAGTGSVGNSGGTISGNVTVERYIPDDGHRAWRLLSVPTTGFQTIYQAWQDTAVNHPGYGTLITSNLYNGSNGFDMGSNYPSILIYDQSTPSWSSIPVNNTNSFILSSMPGYMLFINGDKTATNQNSLHTATTLRSTGSLRQGTQTGITVTSSGSSYTLVGNPFASPIDLEQTYATTANLAQAFYIWDANLGGGNGYGGFRLVERTAANTYQQTPAGGTAVADNTMRYIHSGQAFFLKATGSNASVVFSEASKTNLLPTINPFTPASLQQQITVNLFKMNSDNSLSLADGIRARYDNSFSADATDDIFKINNSTENLALSRDGKSFIIEKRPMITGNETLNMSITNMGIKNYQFQINAQDFVQTNVAGFLQDNFTNTNTPLNLSATTIVNFAVTADAGSSSADRFKIVLSPVNALPLSFTDVKAYQQNNNISVEWKVANEIGIQKYEIEKSTTGNIFSSVAIKNVIGNNQSNVNYNWIDINAVPGNNYYRIRSLDVNGRTAYSGIAKVYIGKGKPSITVYPNPVTDGVIHVELINLPKGNYNVRLVNNSGQVIMNKSLDHAEGSSTESITPGKNIVKGNYILEVKNADGSVSIKNNLRF